MAYFSDNFTGTEDTLVSARTGWAAGPTGVDNAKINSSNAVKFTDTGNDSKVVFNEKGGANHWGQCVAGANFGGGYFPLIARCDGTRDNFYGVRLDGGLWEIWLANSGGISRVENTAGTVTAGDVIRLEAVGTTLTLSKNGTPVLTHTMSLHASNTKVGMYPRGTSPGSAVMDSWESGLQGETGGDTTAPILTSAAGTATGATTANGSVTTDEAGPAWAVLTTSSITPDDAQIKAGQDHTGAFAAASDTATLVVGANADVFAFSGLTGSTAYRLHVVQDDTATPTANTSAPITSASFTTDAPSDTEDPTMNGSITVGTKTANSISISYSAASDNVGVTGYEVSSNGGSSWLDNGTSLSYTFLGLSPLTSYDIRVRAYDAAGNRATPITVNTSTYREGGTVQDVYDNTGAVGGNPQGVLYATAAALVGTEPNSWLSYYTVSGPTPGGGTLDASPLGDFEYFGPDAAVWTIQPELNGADYGDEVVVELYDQSEPPPPGDSVKRSPNGMIGFWNR